MYAAFSQLLYLWGLKEQRGRGFKLKWGATKSKGGDSLYRGVDPTQVFYQNDLRISASWQKLKFESVFLPGSCIPYIDFFIKLEKTTK